MSNNLKKIIYIILALILVILANFSSVEMLSIILVVLLPIIILLEFSPKIKNLMLQHGVEKSVFIKSIFWKLGMISIVLCYFADHQYFNYFWNIILFLLSFTIAIIVVMGLLYFYKAYKSFKGLRFLFIMHILIVIFNIICLIDMM